MIILLISAILSSLYYILCMVQWVALSPHNKKGQCSTAFPGVWSSHVLPVVTWVLFGFSSGSPASSHSPEPCSEVNWRHGEFGRTVDVSVYVNGCVSHGLTHYNGQCYKKGKQPVGV